MRPPQSQPVNNLKTRLKALKAFFDLSEYLIPQADAEQSIREGVSFRGMNIMILIVAIFIASLGLNTNSTAVIIGAMLISPLMGPIIGLGLAVGIHDFELMKRSFRNLAAAASFSVATAAIYFLISPVNEGHSELLARTSPTIYDVLIGFFGGAAGILAIGSKSKGNVIPGVAIATALMPPLCTVGYGLATWQPNYFLGALYLFFINSVFIAVATYVGVKLMRWQIKPQSNPVRAERVRRIVYFIALLTMLPAVWLTYRMFVENNFQQNCSRFIAEEMQWPDTQVLNHTATINSNGRELTVALMGAPLPQDSLLAALDAKLPEYHLQGIRLRIIQGSGVHDVDMGKLTGSMLGDIYAMTQQNAERQQQRIDSLQHCLAAVEAADSLGQVIAPEIKVLFPRVERLAVTRAVICTVEGAQRPDTANIVLVSYSSPMSRAESTKFREYLEARLRSRSLHIVEL